eukprot:8513372-Prorocentrum_lima.AAC.1
MTSSLVGSEMCIRDREFVVHAAANADELPESESHFHMTDPTSGRGAGTVSYTHLTLPTICSV